jgi:predicted ATPase/DNA-binding winged helix-turn-helix (wHTH) protein
VPAERYTFGPFVLEVEGFRLLRGGQLVPLQPKMLELLIRLVRSAGELVPREVLQAELWRDVVVTEQSLRQVVYKLRELLGEEHQHFIETVPRRGFRFVGPVQRVQEQGSPSAYEILGRLGGGGVGPRAGRPPGRPPKGGGTQVFAVRHRILQRQYALKVLSHRSPGLFERLAREARAQDRVGHENVLPILDVIEHEGAPALLLPLVQGPTLFTLLEQRDALQLHDLCALFVGIVRGVAAIHEAGLVHRDLKPGNVLLEPVGEQVVPKVADFGLVKSITIAPLTHAEIAMGTPGWMAPEQLTDAATVDARADVWALGRLLLEMLGTADEPGWQALAQRCLAREPELRPADATELLQQLRELPIQPLSPGLAALCRSLAPHLVQAPAAETLRMENALPAERDTFVGRDEDLRALAELSARLLSVTGPGGVGKTRFALQHARSGRARWPGGAYFCDLSEARDTDGIVRAVSRALEVPLGQDPVLQLGRVLANRGRCLLLLDNFEQIVPFASETVGRWMELAESAQFLVTSREVLDLPGEVVFPLAPLARGDARELFVRRAVAVKRGYSPSPEDLSAIDSLISLLDGLPLALELAAARVSVLSPAQILERMDDRFRVLSPPGARKGRQATLRATLDWSWELLSKDERVALGQLSVFSGGFTLAAAEKVLELEEMWPVDAVQSLLHKSLVVPAPADRFTLLMSTQTYAQEHLSPESAQAAEQRHGQYYAWLGEESEDNRALELELDNLVAACRRAVARGDGAVAAKVAVGAWPVFLHRGPLRSGLQLLQTALSLPLPPAEAAEVQVCLGWALHMLGSSEEGKQHLLAALASTKAGGNPRGEGRVLSMLAVQHDHLGRVEESERYFDQALAALRQAGDRRREGVALTHLGSLRHHQGRMSEAYECHQQALKLLQEVGDRRHQGTVLYNLGVWAREQGRMDEGRAYAEQSLCLDRELGDRMSEAYSLMNLGNAHIEQGRMEEALACYEESLRLYRELGERRGEGSVLICLGACLSPLGRRQEALACYEESLVLARELGDRRDEGVVLGNLGAMYQGGGRPDEARAAYEAALQVHREVGNRNFEGIVLGMLSSLLREQGDLRASRQYIDEGEALLRSVGHLLMLGSVLCQRAELEHADGQPEAARAALGEAASLAERLGAGPSSHLGLDLKRAREFLGS